jgi:hypothetical protein
MKSAGVCVLHSATSWSPTMCGMVAAISSARTWARSGKFVRWTVSYKVVTAPTRSGKDDTSRREARSPPRRGSGS